MATGTTTWKPISPRPEFAGILRDDEVFASGGPGDVGEQINGWFDRLMLQSGVGLAPSAVLFVALCAAVALGGAVFVLQENLLTTAIAGLIGFLVPVAAVMLARTRRQSAILKQMPEMVDELARAARTGRSLEQCLQIVAEDTPDPLGAELRLCARKVRMGVSLGSALRDLPLRTGVTSMNVFVMALTLHQESGGDLVRVLERLSRSVRDRLTFLGRLKVATTASRATAVLMLGLPPAILAFFVFRDPEYLTELWASQWGRTTTMIAITLQVVGSFWVLRILRNSQRT